MDLLTSINELGLPAWVVIAAAVLVILRAVGILDPLVSFFRGLFGMVRERVEASAATERTEQIAIWSQVTKLQSQTLSQNELLLEYIINDIKQTLEDIQSDIKQQKYHMQGVESKITMLIQIISEWYDKRQLVEDDANIKQTQTVSTSQND